MPNFPKFHPLLWSVRSLDIGANKYAYTFQELIDIRSLFHASGDMNATYLEHMVEVCASMLYFKIGAVLPFVLDTVYHWAEENNMIYNGDKFEMLSFGKSNLTSQYLTLQGEPIESKESVRDPGIIFQSNGKFDKQIIHIVGKSTSMPGWILRTF